MFRGRRQRGLPAPGLHDNRLGQIRMQDFIPADHGLVILGHNLLQALVEIGLQILIVLHAVGFHEFLNLRIRVPLLAVDLVAANVEIAIGKQFGHFPNELFQKLVSRLSRGIQDGIDPAAFQRVRAGTGGKFGISQKP